MIDTTKAKKAFLFILLAILGLVLFGCSSPPPLPPKPEPKTEIKPKKPETPPRVISRGIAANKKLVLPKVSTALRSLAYSRTKKQVSVEVHARGKACRVAITGDLTVEEANAIGVSALTVLSMYFEDYIVTVNERIFRAIQGAKPNDGTI